MAKTMKNEGSANNSSRTSRATCESGTSNATFTLQVSNPHSIVRFTDLTAEMQRHFDEEMNAKNRAYSYILSMGLLHDFMRWSRESHYDDPHDACVNQLALLVTDEN